MKFSIQIISAVLICGIITQLFGRLIVLTSFELNKEYIVKELCVQKEEPDNCCQGSCHLKKELEKQDDASPNSQNQQKLKLEQEQDIRSFYSFRSFLYLIATYESKVKENTITDFRNSVFHPPSVI